MQKNRNNIIEYNNIIPFLNKKRDRKWEKTKKIVHFIIDLEKTLAYVHFRLDSTL